jgi:hypothetical protein
LIPPPFPYLTSGSKIIAWACQIASNFWGSRLPTCLRTAMFNAPFSLAGLPAFPVGVADAQAVATAPTRSSDANRSDGVSGMNASEGGEPMDSTGI